MDLAIKFKRAFAIVSTVALLASNASVAIAQTFSDVPTDAWFYDYVEQLVNDGVIDAKDKFAPNQNVTRAEFTKMVITAIDGMAGYEAPATPTFSDVKPSDWFYDYVESAQQLDIVAGYTDAKGNPTGKFGPNDVLNRAAAAKILVNAFSIPTDLDPASAFSDVKPGAWYHDYVVTAFNQSVVDGYKNAAGDMTGKFGPADNLTRAQSAKLIVTGQSPVERETVAPGEEEEETPTPTPTSQGALEVSLNDNTPSSSTVPLSASNVKLLAFDLTAAEDDVTVSNIVMTRGGVGNASDWDNLYIYDGDERLTTGRTLNSDTNTATFPVSLTVEAGTTKSLWLVGEMTATAGSANNQHYFYVASAAAVTSNAQSTAGDFPVTGNTFTTGSVTVNGVTATTGTAIAQPLIGGTDQEISSFKLTAGADNKVAIHAITLTQNGSLSASKMTNLKLLRGSDVVAEAAGFTGDNVTFVLTTPYVIDEGQNRTFYVRTDIEGGRTSDTVQIYLDENTDLVAIDQQYGYGAIITNSTTTGFKPGAAAPLVTATTLKGGEVTIADNGPSAAQIAQNTTNVRLLDYSITTGRDLRVKDMDMNIQIQNAAATGPTLTTATQLGTDTVDTNDGGAGAGAADHDIGEFCVDSNTDFEVGDTVAIPTASGTVYSIITAVDANHAECDDAGAGDVDDRITTNETGTTAVTDGGTVTEVNPYTLLKNVKVVDLDSGSTLQGPITRASDATLTAAAPSDYNKTFTEDYNLTGGDTRHLSVQADIDQNMPDGYSIFVTINYTTAAGYIKDDAANENIAAADIVGGVLTGKTHTTANNSLTVAVASTPTSQTYVKGDDSVSSLGIAMTAGDAGEITVKKIIVRAYANTAANNWADAEGDTAANTLVSFVSLYDGETLVAGPKSISLVDAGAAGFTAGTDYYKATFDNLNLKVAKGGTKTYTAKVKLLNTSTATRYVALDLDSANDITAEDKEANTITPQGGFLNDTVTKSPIITILTSGTLSASSEGNPDAANLVAGKTQQLVAKYRFNALRESFTVNKLTVMNDAAAAFDTAVATNAVSQVTLKYPDINGVTQTKSASLTAGTATLSDLGFYVPKGDNKYIEIYADVNPMSAVGESLSGQTFRLGLQDTANTITTLEAVGTSSSTTVDTTAELTVSNASSVNTFLARKSVPTFAKSTTGTTLTNGETTLYQFTVTADSAGAVSMGRLVFDVTESGLTTLDQVKFYRDGTPLTAGDQAAVNQVYLMWVDTLAAAADLSCTAHTTQATNGMDCDTGIAASGTLIVSFPIEETVSAGQTRTYKLTANVAGATSGDSLGAKIATGDESTIVADSTAPTSTGEIHATDGADAANELFDLTGSFTNLATTARNIIWSDNSADTHVYHVVTAAGTADDTAPTTGVAGSADWTNGYLLKVTNLAQNTLSL